MDKKFDLLRDVRSRVLVAAHRGVMGGNVPGNTFTAFEAALQQGADMLELDITRSNDGVLYVFHPGMEPVFLRSEKHITDMNSSEVDQLVYYNADATATQYHIHRFDDVLEQFKNRCYLNIDKFWMWMDEIARTIRSHGMQEQVLVKTPDKQEYFDMVEQLAPDMPFMTIAWHEDRISEQLMKRRMRFVGIEALFDRDDDPIASREYIDWMHSNGRMVWCNGIIYNYKTVLAGGHSDDISVAGRMDEGWGWIADRGFDIIQTDWPMALTHYLNQTGRRNR